jgi:predicted esterase
MPPFTRHLPLALAGLLVVAAAACAPRDPGADGLYRGVQADIHPVVTPKAQPVTWGAAPVIDEHYGGTLYQETAIEQQDPRPPATADGDEPLRLWVADPHDGRTGRPAILWFHGGGFAVGIDSMWSLANGTAKDYAQRGYVGISVEYRTDTTLVGTGTATQRPPSLCQWVQDNVDPNSQVWRDRRAQCTRNIQAAQADALAAVRWVRAHAADYGIGPTKIAMGGFSAGAVLTDLVAYQHEDVGTHRYFAGDGLSVANSRIGAGIVASGCVPTADFQPPDTMGAGDAPTSAIHSKGDRAVPYSCAANTVGAARDAGLVAELTSYCTESGHAADLYHQHRAATDEQWTTFLVRQLGIYSGTRPPSADPLCR